jgi:hypothetical protein
MSIIKAIETKYGGYKFRSRLEARWAVFFDALNVEWEYEKEGFDIAGVRYLPDFWLPSVKMWAEVKPEAHFDRASKNLCVQLGNLSGFDVLMLGGVPSLKAYPTALGGYQVLSNYHDYPKEEGRFYSMPSDWDLLNLFPDTKSAVEKSLSARFEFGQTP